MKEIKLAEFRRKNSTQLRAIKEPIKLLGKNGQPVGVCLPYETYINIRTILNVSGYAVGLLPN